MTLRVVRIEVTRHLVENRKSEGLEVSERNILVGGKRLSMKVIHGDTKLQVEFTICT